MRKIMVLFLMLLDVAMQAQGINFTTGTWQEALEEAARQEKLIFVDAYAVWCGPCKRMDREVFTNDKVGDFFNSNFINVKMDMEKGEGLKLRAKYRVTAYPTLLFIAGDGTLVERVVGFRPAEALMQEGLSAMEKGMPVEKYEVAYNEGDRSPELIYNYVNALNKAGQSSLRVANEYLRSQSDLNTDFNLRFIMMAAVEVDSRIFSLLEQHHSGIVALEGEQKVRDKVLEASTNTAKKATTFQQEQLLEAAIGKMKSYYPEKAGSFEVTASMEYYLKARDEKAYLKYCNAYVKDYISENPDLLIQQARTLKKYFPDEKKSRDTVESILELAAQKAQKSEYFLLYADILNQHGKQDKALKVLDQAKELAVEEGEKSLQKVESVRKKISAL